MFYMLIRSWGANASTRSNHTGVWVPVHEIESIRSESALEHWAEFQEARAFSFSLLSDGESTPQTMNSP